MVSKEEKLLESWKNLNFPGFVDALDAEAEKLAAISQDEGKRREIMKQIEEVKAWDDPGGSAELVGLTLDLIRGFQGEVHAAEQRCRVAERAFLEAYKGITGMPDPTQVIQKTLKLESELEMSKMELESKGTTLHDIIYFCIVPDLATAQVALAF